MGNGYAVLCHTYTVLNKLIHGLKSVELEGVVRKLAVICTNMTVRFQTSLPIANGTDIRSCLLWKVAIPTRITMNRTVRLDYERWAVSQSSEVEILRVVIEFPEGSTNRSPFKL